MFIYHTFFVFVLPVGVRVISPTMDSDSYDFDLFHSLLQPSWINAKDPTWVGPVKKNDKL